MLLPAIHVLLSTFHPYHIKFLLTDPLSRTASGHVMALHFCCDIWACASRRESACMSQHVWDSLCKSGFWLLQAFLAASLKTDDELLDWFNERLVWNDQAVVTEMLKNGLFVRIFAPQVRVLSCVLCCLYGIHSSLRYS